MAKKNDTKKPKAETPKVKEEKTVNANKAEKKTPAVKLDHSKKYNFESNGTARTMKKGNVYSVSGAMAEIFLKAKYGKIVD